MRVYVLLVGIVVLLATLIFTPNIDSFAEEDDTKDYVFFLHWVNETEASKDIQGYSVRNYFDTTQDFERVNHTVTSGTKWKEDWYLYPVLAGDFVVEEYTLGIWMYASGGQKSAQITLSIYEVTNASENPEGTLVASKNFGNVQLFTTPHFEIFSANMTPHTFPAGSSIRIEISLTPGTSTYITLLWDTPTADSRVILKGQPGMKIKDVTALDYNRSTRTGFLLTTSNKTVYFHAVLTDPFGGYDIKWVNLTLESPLGEIILDNVSMTRVGGTPISYMADYEISWNYSSYPPGRYNITVWAVDNNGYNYYTHFGYYKYGQYQDVYTTYITLGITYSVAFKAVDSKNLPLPRAEIVVKVSGTTVSSSITDDTGIVVLEMFGGDYDVYVIWQGCIVAHQHVHVSENVSRDNPITINCSVYYPIFRIVDSHDLPVSDAAAYITHPNSTTSAIPYKTNENGEFSLSRVPGGDYRIIVWWRGIEVADTSINVSANAVYTIDCTIYYIAFRATDTAGIGLSNAQLIAYNNLTGAVMAFSTTNESGAVTFRLPKGCFNVYVYWHDVLVGQITPLEVSKDNNITIRCSVYYLSVKCVDSKGRGIEGAFLRVYRGNEIIDGTVTPSNGTARFKLAEGNYTILIDYRTTYLLSKIKVKKEINVHIEGNCTKTIKIPSYPPPLYKTNAFILGMLIAILIAIIITLLIIRR